MCSKLNVRHSIHRHRQLIGFSLFSKFIIWKSNKNFSASTLGHEKINEYLLTPNGRQGCQTSCLLDLPIDSHATGSFQSSKFYRFFHANEARLKCLPQRYDFACWFQWNIHSQTYGENAETEVIASLSAIFYL